MCIWYCFPGIKTESLVAVRETKCASPVHSDSSLGGKENLPTSVADFPTIAIDTAGNTMVRII